VWSGQLGACLAPAALPLCPARALLPGRAGPDAPALPPPSCLAAADGGEVHVPGHCPGELLDGHQEGAHSTRGGACSLGSLQGGGGGRPPHCHAGRAVPPCAHPSASCQLIALTSPRPPRLATCGTMRTAIWSTRATPAATPRPTPARTPTGTGPTSPPRRRIPRRRASWPGGGPTPTGTTGATTALRRPATRRSTCWLRAATRVHGVGGALWQRRADRDGGARTCAGCPGAKAWASGGRCMCRLQHGAALCCGTQASATGGPRDWRPARGPCSSTRAKASAWRLPPVLLVLMTARCRHALQPCSEMPAS
jgi:hypothetical protein